jgi:peptidyl-prolyl cis-trans isomerase B (cyclophilin B)
VAGKRERDRKRARERYERQRAERLQRRSKMRRWTGIGSVVVLVLGLAAGLSVAFATGGSTKASPKPTTSHSATPTATPTPTPTPTASTVAEPAHHCTYSAGGPASKKVSLPPTTPDYKATYTAEINTNVGKIDINLLNSKATCTVNSFIHLASADFWNNSQCHRISDSQGLYMLQCGDPLAKATTKLTCATGANTPGTGGPGYEFDNENLTGATYNAGTVAMANSGTNSNGSGTNGSQFFLVFKDSSLQPDYTPFGTITSGLDILQKVANAGTSCTYSGAGGGAPKEKVIIDSVTIKKT